jgi:hypothetical protein
MTGLLLGLLIGLISAIELIVWMIPMLARELTGKTAAALVANVGGLAVFWSGTSWASKSWLFPGQLTALDQLTYVLGIFVFFVPAGLWVLLFWAHVLGDRMRVYRREVAHAHR